MIEVVVVGEGQTEETFVNQVLAPPLWERDIHVQPRLISTSRFGRGGALSRDRVLRFFRNTLRQRVDTYVTTFFNVYGLRNDFPGVASVAGITDPIARAIRIEEELSQAVVAIAECCRERSLAYEFEGLLFSDLTRFSEFRAEWEPFLMSLSDGCAGAASPEHINDGQETHPSARLKILKPRYEKVLHGSALAKRIGLDRIRERCAHFAAWLGRIEVLQPL